MVSVVVLLILIHSVKSFTANNTFKEDVVDRIYGGFDAPIQEYAYAVFLHLVGASPASCGGSLISAQSILTAAHCVDVFRYKHGHIQGYLGATHPNKAKVTRRMVDYRINPSYNERSGKDNLGILFMEGSVPLRMEIQKIPLVVDDPVPESFVYSVGWGKQDVKYGNKLPDISSWRPLKGTRQRIMHRKDCSRYAGFTVSPSHMCALSSFGHFYKDDAGNGIVTKKPTLLLVGVFSFSAEGVNFLTGIRMHTKWIASSCYDMYQRNCVYKRRNWMTNLKVV